LHLQLESARSIKFIYVLSKLSNERDGPLRELATARSAQSVNGLKDFVIPVSIDDLGPAEYSIELHRLNSINFTDGWAKGLNTLLGKLDKDEVQKSPVLGAGTVASWWRDQFSAERGVKQRAEELLSSWFSYDRRPQEIYYHITLEPPKPLENAPKEAAYPTYAYKSGFVSFAPREDFENGMPDGTIVGDSHRFQINDLFDGKHEEMFMVASEARRVVVNLLDQSWRQALKDRGLRSHELANKNWCHYFIKGQLENDKIYFTGVEGKRTWRSMVGYRKFKRPDGTERLRYWHFAISAGAQLFPSLTFNIRSHVIFSDDGEQIWTSDSRLLKARASQCKSWWNAHWRDRMLAAMAWLPEGNENIQIPLSSSESLEVSSWPNTIESPISYDPPVSGAGHEQELEDDLDDLEIEAADDDVYGDEEDEDI
jgi:hypothetical protein